MRLIDQAKQKFCLEMSHQKKNRSLRVLIDMDGVMCNFEGHTLEQFRKKYPDDPFISLDKRRTFYVGDEYDVLQETLDSTEDCEGQPTLGEKVRGLMREKGFFLNIPEIDGAVEAVKEMSGMEGVEVFLCTTPMHKSAFSAQEKIDWVEQHLGADWADRLIMTHDKTMIYGHLLIDDKPCITGCLKAPSWEHILFSQCHNIHVKSTTGRRRLENWTDGSWQPIIAQYLRKL